MRGVWVVGEVKVGRYEILIFYNNFGFWEGFVRLCGCFSFGVGFRVSLVGI